MLERTLGQTANAEQSEHGVVPSDLRRDTVRGIRPQPGRGDYPVRDGTGEQLARLAWPGEELPAERDCPCPRALDGIRLPFPLP